MYNRPTPTVQKILLFTVVVFLLTSFGFRDIIERSLALYGFQSSRFFPTQLVTYMFVHFSIGHLFSNMLGLFFLGPMLEYIWGEKRFLQYYLITGVGAGIIHLLVKVYDQSLYVPDTFFTDDVPTIGASGAIFGLLIASAVLFPNREIIVFPIPFPVQIKYFVGIYCLVEIYQGIYRNPTDNVAHWAHLGGALVGFIVLKIWKQDRNRFY
jgi:membrane associated rhomboid family serine protease